MAKKIIGIMIVSLFFLPFSVIAQEESSEENKTEENKIEDDLQEFLIDSFENKGHWKARISYDVGYSKVKYIKGGASAKSAEVKNQNDSTEVTDETVLGVKVDFLKRAWVPLIIKPNDPIHIRGFVDTIKFFTIGRKYTHKISLLLRNYRGKDYIIPVGMVDHYGWKQMEVKMPESLDQQDPNYPARGGVEFVGFRIDLNAMDIRGDYYVYFDDLRVLSNIAYEKYDKEDDIEDIW